MRAKLQTLCNGHAFEVPYTPLHNTRTVRDVFTADGARRPLRRNAPDTWDTDDIDPRCLQQQHQRFWKKSKRLLYSSTLSVYGSFRPLPSSKSNACREIFSKPRAFTFFGAQEIISERLFVTGQWGSRVTHSSRHATSAPVLALGAPLSTLDLFTVGWNGLYI